MGVVYSKRVEGRYRQYILLAISFRSRRAAGASYDIPVVCPYYLYTYQHVIHHQRACLELDATGQRTILSPATMKLLVESPLR
jgi:hypothetical protein